MLPEFFNAPYDMAQVPSYAEEVDALLLEGGKSPEQAPFDFAKQPPSSTAHFLSAMAQHLECEVIGGSIPERRGDNFFNTCLCFHADGTLGCRFSKLHLNDTAIPGKLQFKESAVLSPGSSLGIFETPFATIGIGICYDMRVPEYALLLAEKKGAQLLCFPTAFSVFTGPVHLKPLVRARAIDGQCFFAVASPAPAPTLAPSSEPAPYPYGHSMASDPWGKVLLDLEESPGLGVVEVDLSVIAEVKQSLRYASQKQPDVYRLSEGPLSLAQQKGPPPPSL